MARGKAAEEGAERVAQNGYHYTKGKKIWHLTHHLIAEKNLGRPLRSDERAVFKDKDRNNLDPSNIIVVKKGTVNHRRRLVQIEDRIRELEAERNEILQLMKDQEVKK